MRYILPLLPVALASADDWQLRDLASQCALGGSSSISFNYYPADAEISTSNFKAQDCTYAQITVTNDQTVDIDGKTFRSYTMSYDPSVCSGATFVAGDLASYSSTTQFEFDTGMTAAGQFLNFRSHIIPASCTYDSSYSLEYNFGKIQKKTDYGESDDDDPTTPDTQSTEGGISFNMAAYSEAARQNLITADALTAGDSSYVTISPATSGVAGFTYAPTSCKLDEDECDDTGACVNKNSFVLFDGAAATCTNAGPLGFTIAYDDATKSWNFEFMLFLFNPAEINQYKLKCEVQVCAENQDPATACNAMAASCLDSSQTYYSPCASGTTWDASSSACTNPLVTNRVYIYPQSTSRIWGFNLKDDFTWDLHVTIDDYIPDRNEAGWYDYGNGYVVYNQDSGNVEWFSIGNGAYRQKVVRYNGDTGAFVSESSIAHGTTDSDNPVWTPTHGTIMIHGNGKVSNPTPGAAGPNVAFPDVPSTMLCSDCQAVYKDGKIFRAVGNNNMFTWLDLSDMTWYAASHSSFSSGMYSQLISWGDKWINLKGTKMQIFEVDTGPQVINNLIEHTVDLNFGPYWSFAFMKGNTMYAWLRSNLHNHYGRKYMFSADGTTYTQEHWHSWSMREQGFSEDANYWSTFI